jgi:voltage-gated potassium channel
MDRPIWTRRTRDLTTLLRYWFALSGRFRVPIAFAWLVFGLVPFVFLKRYHDPSGNPVHYGQCLHHVYFLMFGQPSLPYVDDPLLEAINLAIPPIGIAVIVDGIVRFTYLFFAKRRSDKEWIAVISQTLKGHVVICGAGRVGYRVATQLLSLGHEIVVVEKREDAAFVGVLRDLKVPVLIDDIRSPTCLSRTNVRNASAIVAATDDDLVNLNVALDARKENEKIRVVIRLFDDDLVAKVRHTFKAEALSSSALAAPAMALSALDPRIVHSFQLGGCLMVVSTFIAGRALAGLTVAELHDRYAAISLSLKRGGQEQVSPPGATAITAGDSLTVQSEYRAYLKLREATGEAVPPCIPEAA